MKRWIIGALAVASLAMFPACTENDSVIEERAENAGERIEEAGERVGENLEDAGERVAD